MNEEKTVNNLLNKALNLNDGKYYLTEDVLGDIKENFISKDKIKEKMEELNKEIKNNPEITDVIFKIKQQQILQELLEE